MELDVLRDPQRVAERPRDWAWSAVRHPAFLRPRTARCIGEPCRPRCQPRRRRSGCTASARRASRADPRTRAVARRSPVVGRATAAATRAQPRTAAARTAAGRQRPQQQPQATSGETGDPLSARDPPRSCRQRTPAPPSRRPRGSLRGSAACSGCAFGFAGDRDGALGVRRPAGAAPGRRPQGVRRDGRGRGHGRRSSLPADARRHPRPQRRAAGRLGRRADGRRRPADDRRPGAGDREVPRQPARRRLLQDPRRGCARRAAGSSTSPAGCPSTLATEVVERAREAPATRASTPGATRCATTRPATSPPTWSASSAPTTGRWPASSAPSTTSSPAPTARRATRSAAATGSRSATAPSSTPVDGNDLQTTIDRDLQWYAQRVLRQTVEDAGGDSGFAVVMDTRTGELLALADYPTFDANHPLTRPRRTSGPRALQRRLRAGLGREGADRRAP